MAERTIINGTDVAKDALLNTINDNFTLVQGKKDSDLASATTTDLSSVDGTFVFITGTTAITGLGTMTAGVSRIVKFTGILTLTYNATSLILPTDANITTAVDDVAQFTSLGSGNWICTSYLRGDGTPLAGSGGGGPVTIESGEISGVQVDNDVIFTTVINESRTAGELKILLEVKPSVTDLVVTLYKNGVSEGTVTIATTATTTNDWYQASLTSFTSGSYVDGDIVSAIITQIGTTGVKGSNLVYKLTSA